jgi:AhpD family alkylhydroperoxidase
MRRKLLLWFLGTLMLTGFSAWIVSRWLKQSKVPAGEIGRSSAFRKRILAGPTHLRQELDYWLNHPEEIKALRRAGRVSHGFAKRLVLVVTGVNRCRYCTYAHVHSAARMGFAQDEIERLLAGDLRQADPDEAEALAFATHYAEAGGRPDLEAVSQLEAAYGSDKARDILTTIRLIMLGNLVGNTFDALVSRLRGRPAVESTLQRGGIDRPTGRGIHTIFRGTRAASLLSRDPWRHAAKRAGPAGMTRWRLGLPPAGARCFRRLQSPSGRPTATHDVKY